MTLTFRRTKRQLLKGFMPAYRNLDAMLHDLKIVRTQLDDLQGTTIIFTADHNNRTDHLTSTVRYAYIHNETLILVIEPAVIHHALTSYIRWDPTHQWHITSVQEDTMPVIGVLELRPKKAPTPVLP